MENLPNFFIFKLVKNFITYVTFESEQQKGKMANDGGDQNATDTTGRFEVGSNLTLINVAGTPCAF